MNKYHLKLKKIVEKGRFQKNKKGGITYLLNEHLTLNKGDLLDVFEDHTIARNKLKQELDLFTLGVERIKEYNEAGINWWDYCGDRLINSYPKYLGKLPETNR